MASKIETIGTYLFRIAESGLSLTQNGKPQASFNLVAVKKFVEDKAEIEHFQKQGLLQDGQPGYVDYSSFDQSIVAYLLLFNSATDFSKETAMKNYEQLQLATGWDGAEFDSLTNGALVDKIILGRVGEKKAYINKDGKQVGGDGTLEVSWIDHKDADPIRSLKSIDGDQVSKLNAMLKGMGKVAAKPAASAPKPAAKPSVVSSAPSTAASSAASPSLPTAPAASAPSAPAAPKPPAKRKAKEPEAVPAPAPASGPPAETTQGDAWAFVNTAKGSVEDQAVEEAWIDATAAVLGDRNETEATGADWAKVRDLVLAKLIQPIAA